MWRIIATTRMTVCTLSHVVILSVNLSIMPQNFHYFCFRNSTNWWISHLPQFWGYELAEYIIIVCRLIDYCERFFHHQIVLFIDYFYGFWILFAPSFCPANIIIIIFRWFSGIRAQNDWRFRTDYGRFSGRTPWWFITILCWKYAFISNMKFIQKLFFFMAKVLPNSMWLFQ